MGLYLGNNRVKIRTAPYVKYTVTGTPTIIDNVMSNFSNSNYATTTSAFEVANYDNVEIYVRAKTPVTTSAGWTDIIENGGVGSYRNLGAYANGALTAYYFNFFGHDFWRYNISADTWYRLKLTTTADTQSGYIYDDNGNLLYQSENLARRIAGTSVLSFGGRYSPNKIGAIDFNNTYIKVNGQYWFNGVMTDRWALYSQMKGPVGYTVVGSPTITDGVVSGFSTSNFLTLTSILDTSNPFCFKTKIRVSSFNDTNGIFGASNSKDHQGLGLTIAGGIAKIRFFASSNGSSWDISNGLYGTTVLTANTDYYVKLSWDGETYLVQLSTDNSNWNNEISVSSQTPLYKPDAPYNIGYVKYAAASSQFFRGSIDLNETYIKVNGQLWFGKDFIRIS